MSEHSLIVFKIPGCTNCSKACAFLDEIGVSKEDYTYIDIATLEDTYDIAMEDAVTFLETHSQSRVFPQIFVKGTYIGDYIELVRKYEYGFLADIFKNKLDIHISINV